MYSPVYLQILTAYIKGKFKGKGNILPTYVENEKSYYSAVTAILQFKYYITICVS